MKKLLVPTDFTPVSSNALDQACLLAKVGGWEVVALHVVSKQDKVKAAREKIDAQTAEKSSAHGVPVEGVVRIGNIFDGIGQAAVEMNANLVVMGTHGMKGLQYLTGSHAMKVIAHSPVPFIICQSKAVPTAINNIVMAIDLNQESKQMLGFGVEIARLFDSRIHLFSIKQSDPFHKTALSRNVGYAKTFLNEAGVSYDIHIQDVGGKSFSQDVVEYASTVNCDMIVIMNFEEDQIFTMFGSSFEQHMITNKEEIPVLIVNRKNYGVFEVRQFKMT